MAQTANEQTDAGRADLLYGLQAIAAHLGMTPRQAQALIEKDALPSFKTGKIVCSTKGAIAKHFAEQMQRTGKA